MENLECIKKRVEEVEGKIKMKEKKEEEKVKKEKDVKEELKKGEGVYLKEELE